MSGDGLPLSPPVPADLVRRRRIANATKARSIPTIASTGLTRAALDFAQRTYRRSGFVTAGIQTQGDASSVVDAGRVGRFPGPHGPLFGKPRAVGRQHGAFS